MNTQKQMRKYFGSLQKLLLCSFDVVCLSLPTFEHGGLQCTTETEAQGPGLNTRHLVDCIQVYGRLLLRLATGKERDT